MITTANGTYGPDASPYQSAPKEYGVGGLIANRQRGSDQVTIRQQARPVVRIDNSFDATPSLQVIPIRVGTYLSIVGGVVTYVGGEPEPPVTTTAAPTTGAPTTSPPTTVPPTTVAPTTLPPTTLPPTTLPPTTLPPTTLPPTTVPPTTLPPTTLPPTTLPPTTVPPSTDPPTTPPP